MTAPPPGAAARRAPAAARPERAPAAGAGGGAAHYAAAEAARYTDANAGIQEDLAARALALLGLGERAPPGRAVADLGCGSALAAPALAAAGLADSWLGLDVAPAMLELAAGAATGAAGRLARADLGQGLPLRAGALDAAISVSAAQWVLFGPDPAAAAGRLAAGLRRALRPGARAALQVYLEDDAQAAALLGAARAAGYAAAGLFWDFPHDTPAKKAFLCVRAPGAPRDSLNADAGAAAPPRALSARACCLAWPRAGVCALAWGRYLEEELGAGAVAALEGPRARLRREHAAAARRALRLLRRATAGGAEALAARGAAGAGAPEAAAFEAALEHRGLQPCGGPVLVALAAPARALAPEGGDGGAAAAARLAAALIGGGAGGAEGAPRPAPAGAAALRPLSWPRQLAAQLAAGDSSAGGAGARPFYWVEAPRKELEGASEPAAADSDVRFAAAVLRARKGGPLLLACSTHAGAGALGAAASRLRGALAALGAGLVALDARLGGDADGGAPTSAAWLVYVPRFEGADGALFREARARVRAALAEPAG
jgi:18S rRNA (guanine1575-N7)-methyltransferase